MVNAAHLESRAVLSIGGPDAKNFLQNLVTQDIETLNDGDAAFAALLTPQGKILFDFLIMRKGPGFLLDCAAESADALVKRLMLYRLRAKVMIEKTGHAVGAVWGARPPAATNGNEAISIIDPRLEELGRRIIGPKSIVTAMLDQTAGPAAEQAYDAHRITVGVPEFGKDFASDEMFLLDVNYDALHGVSYKKGCFVGQEVTSRMKRKGDVRRRTLKLAFESAPPAKGTPVAAGDSTLGEVLSGAGGAALALIRLDRWAAAKAADVAVEAAGRPVQIIVSGWLEHG